MKVKAKYIHYSLIFFCLLIFAESSIPGDKLPKTEFEFNDKFIHAGIYFVLYILFFYSLKYQSKSVKLHRFSYEFALLFTVLYGLSDELHQYFVPNRSCEFYDWIADIAGAIIGMIVIKFFLLKRVQISIVFLVLFFSGCHSSQEETKLDNNIVTNIYITEADCWLDKMPGSDSTKNKFRFSISVNVEDDLNPKDIDVRNLVIYLNNDTLRNVPFEKDVFETTKGLNQINLIHDLNKVYLDHSKAEPVEAKFEFDIYIKNIKSDEIKTDKFKILTVY